MKKKITALLLALLFVGSLASCGGSENTNVDEAEAVAASKEESVTYSGEGEVGDAASSNDSGSVAFDAETALAYFETSEGKEWLYQYFFGVEETDDVSTEEEVEITSAFDSLTTEEKAQQIIDYLKQDDVVLLTTVTAATVSITEDTTLSDYADFAGKEEVELVEELENKFDAAAWIALYENGFDNGQKVLFLAWYTENNTDPGPESTEGSGASVAENADVSSIEDGESASDVSEDTTDEGEEGTTAGYDAWLSAKLKENADDRSKVWNDLTGAALLQEYLATDEGQTFLGSDEVQQLLADYYSANEDAMKDLAVSTGYRAKMVKNSFIILAIVVVVLLALFAGVLLLLLSRASKREDKLRQKLKEAEKQLKAVPTRPAGGMDLALKQKLTASPVRKTPVAPVTPVAPPTPPVVKTPSKPIEPEKPVTQPVVPAASIITGYYSLAEEAVEAARYHLSPKFSVRKVSDQPTNPPTPYVGYSDHTLDLNREYYAKAGGNKANNARAWDYLMGATVQITECFSIVSQDGTPIMDVPSATGKQIVSVERAKMGVDGSIIARGTITLA